MLALFTLLFTETGKLEEFENELKKPVQHDSNNHEEDDDDNDLYSNLDEEEDEDNNFCIQLFLYLFYHGFIGSEPLDQYKLQPIIYNDCNSGRYSYDGISYDADLEIKYIHHSKTLNGISVNGSFFVFNAFNLKLLFQNFEETYGNVLDKMEYYELFIDYYRCRLPGINWYWGIGAKGLDRSDQYWGPALNTGFEIYPFKPISLEFAANIGWLNAHPVSKYNAGIKIHYWKVMLSSEFQRLRTGNSAINSLNLGVGFNF